MQRAQAFETDDDHLRCYIDQLPPGRCLFCATPIEPRQIRVEGPLHRWSSLSEMADTGGVADKLAVAGVLLGGGTGVVRARSQQTKGRVWMSVCWKCAPSPKVPLLVTGGLVAGTVLMGALGYVPAAIALGLGAVAALVVAVKRTKLSVGEIDEDDFMFKIRGVDDGVKAEVLALGAEPHPANQHGAKARLRA